MDKQFNRYYTHIKPIMRNKYVKTYSGLVFTIVTIIVFSIFAIRPTITTILSLQVSIQEQQKTLDQLKQKIDNLNLGKNNLQNIDPTVRTKTKTLVPDAPNLPDLLNDLSIAALNQQASVSGIQFQPSDLQKPPTKSTNTYTLQEIEFTLSAQGSYTELIKVLENLSKTNRLIKIDLVNFSKPEDSALRMSVNGKAYYYKY
jgi:Tfp pilus assembly protein PilO